MLRHLEGFESRQSATYLARVYQTVGGAINSYQQQRKNGFSSARAASCALTTYPLVAADSNTWIIGFGYIMEDEDATPSLTVMNSSSVHQMSLAFATGTTPNTFVIAVKRGSTTLATTGEISVGRWHYFELKVTVRTGANGSFELRKDGSPMVSGAGVNTADTGVDGASVIQFNFDGQGRLDDFYVCDDTGGINDDFLGDKVVLGILPTAEGFENDWLPSTGTNNAALVDDTAVTPNDSDYIQSDVTGDVDLYEFADISDAVAADGTIDAVVVGISAAMLSAGGRGLKTRFRNSGGSTADSAQFDVTQKGSFRIFLIPFDEDPVATAAWTPAALDGGQLGVVNFAEL